MTDPDINDPHATRPAETATSPPAAGERPEQDPESSWMLRRHFDPSLNPDDPLEETVAGTAGDDPRARIEWVRPTDLFARVSARVGERGVEWNKRAHEWARENARATIADSRAAGARLGHSITARLTRTGAEPAAPETVRL
ncbi:hypothetical protein [Gulosibacter molinativorax]|uniref:Uncharacterized protein n=1 Tax=Gulosibacter molinativorax TaxID=256821 RepID=A0ABT7C510_9MICO|nr:hypothetical protein [Gulosibacter molinativorax]MDJ1370277.1 hypothetical protein [Gulosibacter molinativorax]QUY61694.1 Hypotetical protein [Gulosibacter molinativorax]